MYRGPETAGKMGVRGTERGTLWPGFQEQGEEEREPGGLRGRFRILLCGKGPLGEIGRASCRERVSSPV